MALGDPEVKALDFLDFRHYEGGKVATLTHRPSLPPGVSWNSILEAEPTTGHMAIIREVQFFQLILNAPKIVCDNLCSVSHDTPFL